MPTSWIALKARLTPRRTMKQNVREHEHEQSLRRRSCTADLVLRLRSARRWRLRSRRWRLRSSALARVETPFIGHVSCARSARRREHNLQTGKKSHQQWLHVPMPPKNHSIQFLFYSPVDELITYVYVIARRATHPTPPVQSPPPLRGSRTAPGARASPVAAAHTPLARRRCDLPDSPWLRPPRCKDRRDDSSVKQGPAAGPCTTSSK